MPKSPFAGCSLLHTRLPFFDASSMKSWVMWRAGFSSGMAAGKASEPVRVCHPALHAPAAAHLFAEFRSDFVLPVLPLHLCRTKKSAHRLVCGDVCSIGAGLAAVRRRPGRSPRGRQSLEWSPPHPSTSPAKRSAPSRRAWGRLNRVRSVVGVCSRMWPWCRRLGVPGGADVLGNAVNGNERTRYRENRGP